MDVKGKIECNHIVGDPPVRYIISSCPRCRGRGWYGGISFNNEGQISLISGFDQVSQQIEKIILENIRNTGYGLSKDILLGVADRDKIPNIKREVIRSLTYLKNNQVNARKSGFYYDGTEELRAIENIELIQSKEDPRQLDIYVSVITMSGGKIETQLPLKR